MLNNIPCHLIAGPLGAGKSSLIRSLLAQRPAHERWAVLVNEFGEIGLDAALLASSDGQVEIAEIAGGCLCCVNGLPFQVGLNRLLRKSRPQRLLIEVSGLGHPLQLIQQLSSALWQPVLVLQPLVLVLDAAALAAGQALPAAQEQALSSAGLVLLNKAQGIDALARERLLAQLPLRPFSWRAAEDFALAELPGSVPASTSSGLALPQMAELLMPAGQVWRDLRQPFCAVHEAAEGWSIGWRWHPSQRFDRVKIAHWLAGLQWRRAKLVLQDEQGAQAANAVDNSLLSWSPSAWRRDSRIELIFKQAQDPEILQAAMAACRQVAEFDQ